jgi:hypothetical protein
MKTRVSVMKLRTIELEIEDLMVFSKLEIV